MSKSLTALTFVVIAVLVAGGVVFGYATNRISFGNVMFLASLAVTCGVVAAVLLKRISHPDVSVEQMLYETDHPSEPRLGPQV